MKERIKSIDCLRGLAILAVIAIHTTTRTLEASKFDVIGFSSTLFLNQIARFAVPLFMMISGFVLEISAKDESYWSFVKRRFTKIFIPYTFWSLIYYFFIYNNNHENLLEVLLKGDATYQLYFIPALLIFYLTFPLVHKLIYKIPNRIILAVVSVAGLILLSRNYYIKAFDLGDGANATILSYVYFIAGTIAAKNKNTIDKIANKYKLFLSLPTALLAFYVFLEGRNRYLATGNYLAYYSQWRPSIFVYTIFIAFTFYYLFEHTKLKSSIISRFAKHSFFVFFIHVIILELFWKFTGSSLFFMTGSFYGEIFFDLLFIAFVFAVSFFVSFLFHKIPNIEKVIG